jgi:TPR repeat protein
VPQSFTKAVRLYKLAAADNLPCAQFNLGFMFQRGIGVEQDTGEALRLYALAAAQGDQDAKRCLAHISNYIPCFRSYSAALPRYVAIAHAVTTSHLRRRVRLHQPAACSSRVTHPAPACSAAACDSVEVTRTARLRVCSSGVASFLSNALAKSIAAKSASRHDRDVICSWACSIAARVHGTRCIVVKASCYGAAVR